MDNYFLFKRAPIECDMAEVFCPVQKPCNDCNEFFNSLPFFERAYWEIPRYYGLIKRWIKGESCSAK